MYPTSLRSSVPALAIAFAALLTILAPEALRAGEAPALGAVAFLPIADGAGSPGASLGDPAVARSGLDLMVQSTVQGTPPIALQWWFNGEALPGATNASFRIPSLETADEGRYSLTASNAFGSAATVTTPLFVSNISPSSFVGLTVAEPVGTRIDFQYADALSDAIEWRPLTNATLASTPFLVVDPGSDGRSTRFYRTGPTLNVSAHRWSGWTYPGPTGSVHKIEFLDTKSAAPRWQPLATVTVSNSPLRFVDTNAPDSMSRKYRTTQLQSPSARRIGRLGFSVKWTLPAAGYDALKPEDKAGLTAQGVTLDDASHAILMGTKPMPGYWIVMGDQRVMTDTNGAFSVDVPYGVTNGVAVSRHGARSTEAEASFTLDQLVPAGQTPGMITLHFEHTGPLNMDGAPAGTIAGAPRLAGIGPAEILCGNPGVHVGNTRPCCLDYNGYNPTDCKGGTLDIEVAVTHYIGSTCHQLVEAGLCAREWNALRFVWIPVPPFVLPLAPLVGPSCFVNHKYRNCQNIDKSFTIVPDAEEIASGGTVTLTVHNNTWANETVLTAPAGDLTGDQLQPGTGSSTREIQHWVETPDPKHLEDCTVTFVDTAHSPAGTYLTFTAEAAGQRVTARVRVKGSLKDAVISIPAQPAGAIWSLPAEILLTPNGPGSTNYVGSNKKPERGSPFFSIEPRLAGATFYTCDLVTGFPTRLTGTSPTPNRTGGSSFIAIAKGTNSEPEIWIDASVGAFRISGDVTFNWEYQVRYYSGSVARGLPALLTIGSVPNADIYNPQVLPIYDVLMNYSSP